MLMFMRAFFNEELKCIKRAVVAPKKKQNKGGQAKKGKKK